MDLNDVDQLLTAIEEVARLFLTWNVETSSWCVLDGPAIKLHHHDFDASAWRDHLNIYVREAALPWKTTEVEQTVPPNGSKELTDLLAISRRGIHLHLVPAERYYRAGFEHKPVRLLSGRRVEAATLRGCSQMWCYKSAEVTEGSVDFGDDIARIVGERMARLEAALVLAKDDDIRGRIFLLQKGYAEFARQQYARARAIFREAAGPAWISETNSE